jgi:hypothetical protein
LLQFTSEAKEEKRLENERPMSRRALSAEISRVLSDIFWPKR